MGGGVDEKTHYGLGLGIQTMTPVEQGIPTIVW